MEDCVNDLLLTTSYLSTGRPRGFKAIRNSKLGDNVVISLIEMYL